MKQIPLKEYLKKIVDNKKHTDGFMMFQNIYTYTYKSELIKSGIIVYSYSRRIFRRYMNNSKWKWKWK